MTLTKLSKVFTKETLIFSKMVDKIHRKISSNQGKVQNCNER